MVTAKLTWTTPCLIAVIAIQWVLFTALLLQKKHHADLDSLYLATAITNTSLTNSTRSIVLDHDVNDRTNHDGAVSKQRQTAQESSSSSSSVLSGVAVTVIFRSPKWFFLRYKVMIDNALSNLPDANTWKVQIFVNEPWIRDTLLPWHPGLQQIFFGNDPRVIVTPLPKSLIANGQKPRDVLLSRWFWETMAADRVVLFSGNGAFCGNKPRAAWDAVLDLDYLGVPSSEHHAGTEATPVRTACGIVRPCCVSWPTSTTRSSPSKKVPNTVTSSIR